MSSNSRSAVATTPTAPNTSATPESWWMTVPLPACPTWCAGGHDGDELREEIRLVHNSIGTASAVAGEHEVSVYRVQVVRPDSEPGQFRVASDDVEVRVERPKVLLEARVALDYEPTPSEAVAIAEAVQRLAGERDCDALASRLVQVLAGAEPR